MPSAAAKEIRLLLEIPTGLPPIETDASRVEQILVNLLTNAIKYTPERSVILVSAHRSDTHVTYRVQDEGPGIREDEAERIFDIYVTKNDGDKQGIGLGLPLSRRLARLLGGDLQATPQVGAGDFLAGLAAAPQIVKNSSSRVCRPAHRHFANLDAMKILVVEDERKVASFIKQGLEEEGHAIDVAIDGEQATMMAHVYEYDAILLDVMLPKKNGFQVAAELRREGRNTPIIMLTSRDASEDVVRGLDAGADDYLAKPFQFEELLARLRALARRGGAERIDALKLRTASKWTGCSIAPRSMASAWI